MAIAQSLLSMAEEEIAAKNCNRLELVRVEYGALSGVVPESLEFCFEALTKGTPHEGAAPLNWSACPCVCAALFAARSSGGKARMLFCNRVRAAGSNSGMSWSRAKS